jgi:cystathionine beta-synthase
MDFTFLDDVIRVSDKDCFQWTRKLVRAEGIYAGGSSGGAVCAAIRYAEQTGTTENILVILPDSAGRYLSKIFNDTWMKEGGYLDTEIGDERIGDLLRDRGVKLVSAAPDDSFATVITGLKENGFSQLPVIDDSGRLMGLIRERDMLEALLNKEADADTPIREHLDNGYALVEAQNRASLLSQLFAQGKVVVVEERGRVAGILTNIDFIDWMAARMSAQ